ncbi:hypothetical protein [Leptospira noguchii]|uniref:Uncharacterized protein n=1 Tax=Leptospira noguchii TaxID=28182 RepID=A0AAE9GG55_9LEPT|nr:hypothetical protein [Leptospira noguchii]UOG58550.1 hypothetical protein MAL03_19675 [Leptospira noguchii]
MAFEVTQRLASIGVRRNSASHFYGRSKKLSVSLLLALGKLSVSLLLALGKLSVSLLLALGKLSVSLLLALDRF